MTPEIHGVRGVPGSALVMRIRTTTKKKVAPELQPKAAHVDPAEVWISLRRRAR